MHPMTCGCAADDACPSDRRAWLKKAGGGALLLASLGLRPGDAQAAALTQAQRDAMTPDQVIEMMKRSNERFRAGKMRNQDFLAQKRASASGQYPAAAILSCIDSRAPAEIVLDLGIGDVFNSRVAGNVSNADILGSLEFACQVAGAKVVLVMGHTACGAIKGAIDGVQLGNLTGLLAKIAPSVKATAFDGPRTSANDAFVDAVAATHVRLTVEAMRRDSAILRDLEAKGQILMVGAVYDLGTAAVTWLPTH